MGSSASHAALRIGGERGVQFGTSELRRENLLFQPAWIIKVARMPYCSVVQGLGQKTGLTVQLKRAVSLVRELLLLASNQQPIDPSYDFVFR